MRLQLQGGRTTSVEWNPERIVHKEDDTTLYKRILKARKEIS